MVTHVDKLKHGLYTEYPTTETPNAEIPNPETPNLEFTNPEKTRIQKPHNPENENRKPKIVHKKYGLNWPKLA